MVCGVVHGPEGAHGAESVIEELAAFLEGDSQGLELGFEPSGADADDEAAAGDDVDAGEFFGDERWVALGQDDDAAGNTDALGMGGDPGEGYGSVEKRGVGRKREGGQHGIGENDVLSRPEGFEARGFGGLRDRNRGSGIAAGAVVDGEETDLHRRMIAGFWRLTTAKGAKVGWDTLRCLRCRLAVVFGDVFRGCGG